MARLTGRVKWFSDSKGYGFVEREDGDDVFVHHSAIDGIGYRTLTEGERVEFEILEEEKGQKAHNVVRLDPQAATPSRRDRAIQSPTDHRLRP